jgi:hypothetical protein
MVNENWNKVIHRVFYRTDEYSVNKYVTKQATALTDIHSQCTNEHFPGMTIDKINAPFISSANYKNNLQAPTKAVHKDNPCARHDTSPEHSIHHEFGAPIMKQGQPAAASQQKHDEPKGANNDL